MFQVLNSHQISEWKAFDIIEPMGGYGDSHRAAIIASTIANVYRQKESEPFMPEDYMHEVRMRRIFVKELPKKQPVKVQKELMMALVAATKKPERMKRAKRKIKGRKGRTRGKG